MRWRNVLGADLDRARSPCASERECDAEVKIVGKYDRSIVARPPHDFFIGCVPCADRRPVYCFKTSLFENWNPVGRQVHIDKHLHAGASGTSTSSTRHAAYAKASRMSSSVRYG